MSVFVANAVDEEGWRSAHPALEPAEEHLTDARFKRALGQLSRESEYVEANPIRVPQKGSLPKLPLILEEQIVHLPESTLGARRFGGFGSLCRVGVRRAQRKIPEHKPEPLPQGILNPLHDRVGRAAVTALVTTVLDKRYRGRREPLDVIAVPDRVGQMGPSWVGVHGRFGKGMVGTSLGLHVEHIHSSTSTLKEGLLHPGGRRGVPLRNPVGDGLEVGRHEGVIGVGPPEID